ncbi:MAG: peroxiredoxin family protein [Salibacteraceae bacterium]
MKTDYKNIIAGLVVSLSLFSCVEEKKEVVGPFTDLIDFNKEILSQSGSLTKRVIQNVGVESKTISSPNWNIELKPFLEADFNKPANKDKYVITIDSSNLSGWKDVIYVSKDDALPVDWAIYRFVDSTCVAASINVNRSSSAYHFKEELTYIKGSGYTINNQQELTRVDENSFYLTGEFENSSQPWRMFFDIGEQNIPVNFWMKNNGGHPELTFSQGKENIKVSSIKTDSGYMAEIPIFQAYLLFEMTGEQINGTFHNLDKGPDYVIPFSANKLAYEQSFGYEPKEIDADFSGKWETYFYDDGDSSAAIGIFDRLGNDLIGTFATETGDYRFLQGKIMGDSFSLSTFDGSHLFLFTGKINGDEITEGHFYSGAHYHATWKANRNNNFKLIDPNSMTSLKETDMKINFSFPDLNGQMVSLTDDRYNNKVVILQIMGSWCPNCMDETRYFKELYEKYNSKGLEIIGLGFERSTDFEEASRVLNKAIADMEVPYPVLIAGTPKNSAKALPMITPIQSYPTSIFLNKQGEVEKIHTGFYGPSTGKYYDDYTNETEAFITELLSQ